MSHGSWQASDGNWYPPEQHPDPAYRARFGQAAPEAPVETRRRRGPLLVGLAVALVVGAGVTLVALTLGGDEDEAGEAVEHDAPGDAEEPGEPSDAEEPGEPGDADEPAGEDDPLVRLLPALPYRETGGQLPFLVLGDLELAWEAAPIDRPADARDWHDVEASVDEHPLSGARGSLPPGNDFIRAVSQLEEVPFGDELGFGPADVDQFVEWHGGDVWAATLRDEAGDVASALEASDGWQRQDDDPVWYERRTEAEDSVLSASALVLEGDSVVLGESPADAGSEDLPGPLGSDGQRLSDVDALRRLATVLSGRSTYAWVFHGPPVVERDWEQEEGAQRLPAPYDAGAYATVVDGGAETPTLVLVHDDAASAEANAAALHDRRDDPDGDIAEVQQEDEVLWVSMDGDLNVVSAMTRVSLDIPGQAAPGS